MRKLLGGGRRHGLYWFAWLCLGFGFYQLLTGTYTVPELLVGLGSAVAGAAAAVVARRQSGLELRVSRNMAGALAPLPARAAYAAIEVLWTLARESARGRRVEGRMVAVAVDPGGADPVSAARRVLLDLAVCATPNTFSTGLDRDAGVMVVHQLATSGPQPLPPVRL